MTVEWSRYAQSLTRRPMKGMLTGPVTILQWSFVRDDQPRSESCMQTALALRDGAVDAFRIATAGVGDRTQIHTHMCYAEFGDILEAIAAMDADVLSIETSRSKMELLADFGKFKYPNEIGPGVFDIHSPRIPSSEEMDELLMQALAVIPGDRLWVNPDCGLKTRGWPEVRAALANMVEAARRARRRPGVGAP